MRPVGRTDVDGWCRDCCRPSCVTQLVMVTWAADPSVTVLRLLSLCGRCLGQTLTEVDDGS